MDTLLIYLNSLDADAQAEFAVKCGTTVGYLRKACSTGQRIGEGLCMKLERESAGVVRCEALRPDFDWAYIRNSLHHLAPLEAGGVAPAPAKDAAGETAGSATPPWDGVERRHLLDQRPDPAAGRRQIDRPDGFPVIALGMAREG